MLEAIADLEEKRSGEFLFDRAYLTTRFGELSGGGRRMVESSRSSPEEVPRVDPAHAASGENIGAALGGPRICGGTLRPALSRITGARLTWSAARCRTSGGCADRALPVPDGFVITAAAFARFSPTTGSGRRSRATGRGRESTSWKRSNGRARRFGQRSRRPMPPELGEAVGRGGGSGSLVRRGRVRGSQQRGLGGRGIQLRRPVFNCLDVAAPTCSALPGGGREPLHPAGDLLREDQGLCGRRAGDGCRRHADGGGARRGGAYSRDPVDPGREVVVMSGVWGLGTAVVDGAARADTHHLARDGRRARRPGIARQGVPRGRRRGGGGGHGEAVKEGAGASLSDRCGARRLARHGAAPRALRRAQDIEWALDGRRAASGFCSGGSCRSSTPPAPHAHAAAVGGVSGPDRQGHVACRGVGAGPVSDRPGGRGGLGFPGRRGAGRAHHRDGFRRGAARAAALVTDVGWRRGTWRRSPGSTGCRRCSTPAPRPRRSCRSGGHRRRLQRQRLRGAREELLEYAAQKREALEGTPLLLALGRGSNAGRR